MSSSPIVRRSAVLAAQNAALRVRRGPPPWLAALNEYPVPQRQLYQQQQRAAGARFLCATASSDTLRNDTTTNPSVVPPPSRSQLRAVMIQAALPMVGFGFMDQTIMIHAGNAIDCTIGVSLGLSTLAAAAVGQIVANAGGILFGETLQRFFTRFLWVPSTNMTAAQLSLKIVEQARFSGTFAGIIVGCVLGLANLLCIDTKWSQDMKVTKALAEAGAFHIQVSTTTNNTTNDNNTKPVTTLTIGGPDVDGILATLLSALRDDGYSVLEMSAKPNAAAPNLFEDIIVVQRRGGEAMPEEELANKIQNLLKEKLIGPSSASSSVPPPPATAQQQQQQQQQQQKQQQRQQHEEEEEEEKK